MLFILKRITASETDSGCNSDGHFQVLSSHGSPAAGLSTELKWFLVVHEIHGHAIAAVSSTEYDSHKLLKPYI
jgi:hypothetical protein